MRSPGVIAGMVGGPTYLRGSGVGVWADKGRASAPMRAARIAARSAIISKISPGSGCVL